MSNSGGLDLLVPAGIIGLGTAAVHLVLTSVWDIGPVMSAGIAAAILGIASALWATRAVYSSTALALIGITGALLPGLTVYQGVYAEMISSPDALGYFASAGGIVLVLAIGTSLGFVIAERLILHRVHRLEAKTTAGSAQQR